MARYLSLANLFYAFSLLNIICAKIVIEMEVFSMHQFYELFSFIIPFAFFFIFFSVIITFISSFKSLKDSQKSLNRSPFKNTVKSKDDHNQSHLQQHVYQHAYSKKKKDSFSSQDTIGGIKDKPLSEAERNVLYGK